MAEMKIADHRAFLSKIINDAQYMGKPDEWSYIIALTEGDDVVFFEKPKDIRDVMKRVKIAIDAERPHLKYDEVDDEFHIFFYDGSNYDAGEFRYPDEEEKRRKLISLIKSYIYGKAENRITGNQYRVERGKILKGKTDEVLNFIKNRSTNLEIPENERKAAEHVLYLFEEYCKTTIPYRDLSGNIDVSQLEIIGAMDVKIEYGG